MHAWNIMSEVTCESHTALPIREDWVPPPLVQFEWIQVILALVSKCSISNQDFIYFGAGCRREQCCRPRHCCPDSHGVPSHQLPDIPTSRHICHSFRIGSRPSALTTSSLCVHPGLVWPQINPQKIMFTYPVSFYSHIY